MSRLSARRLRALRNAVPIDRVIVELSMVAKEVEGYFRFLCPLCGDFHTATNPRTNLGRCFRCQRNFNPIDLVMTVRKTSFLEAVKWLEKEMSSDLAQGGGESPPA